ncbi:ABC transporter permease subunit [Rhodobacterales bacterium]|nr:ABC transporter permease subunit [Rhodobacterales bacterium]
MITSLWYSSKARGLAIQIALLGGLIGFAWWIGSNTVDNLIERQIKTGFDFLTAPARFPISETVVTYSPDDSFLWAYVVGVANTLWLSMITIVLATLGGLCLALARLSSHPLLSRLASGYVTLFRNIPLIVQLLFFYGLATSVFPPPSRAISVMPGVYLSLRGVYAPSLTLGPGSGLFLVVCCLAVLTAVLARRSLRKHLSAVSSVAVAVIVWIGICLLGWLLTGRPVGLEMPMLKGLNFQGGLQLSPEFSAIIIGLTLYTSAFAGEVIRGGVEAINKGQWEGGRALGLSERQILFRIIMPQALRVIVPPMTSQYLSTVKNTTLAVAVGYPELGLVVNTVINQTGQALESILIMLAVFLTISLSVSLLMNWYNARIALVER